MTPASEAIEKNPSEPLPEEKVLLKELSFLFTASKESLNSGRYAEGIYHLVSILGKGRSTRGAEASALLEKAKQELLFIEHSLTMETGDGWQDEKGGQRTGIADIKLAQAPAIILTMNYGGGKVVVPDVPLEFSFRYGLGRIEGNSRTDSRGNAKASILAFSEPGKEAVVRVQAIFESAGYRYALENVVRDFVFLPRKTAVAIVIKEKTPVGVRTSSILMQDLQEPLKEIPVAWIPKTEGVGESLLRQLTAGEKIQTKDLGPGLSHVLFVSAEAMQPEQVKYEGKSYQLFTVRNISFLKLLDLSDGKLLFAKNFPIVQGRGGTAKEAIDDSFAKAGSQIKTELKKELETIRTALN